MFKRKCLTTPNNLVFYILILTPCLVLSSENEWIRRYIRSTDTEDTERETRASDRIMYLNQGVEFVFPLGVHYTLANVNEQHNFPVSTTGFEAVLEFPKNKMAIMFSSMVNTLRLANFSVYSTIYTNESGVQLTPALRILGTDMTVLSGKELTSPSVTQQINQNVATQTGGIINDFIPKSAYYGSAIYPFTKAVLANTIKYENYWAWPWRDGGLSKFSDSPRVPFMEVEGLMPYYENEAFAAVAALFKGGSGSVVFLMPKGNVTILQLMLQPTALTEIFDENFPGWGVKTMKVKVPASAFTTTTRHAETLQKRGVVDTFCSAGVRENLFGVLGKPSSFFLNPIVQTNHVQISREGFRIASATGTTLNSQAEYDEISRLQVKYREDAEEEDEEEEDGPDNNDETEATTISPIVEDGVSENNDNPSDKPEAEATSPVSSTDPQEQVPVVAQGDVTNPNERSKRSTDEDVVEPVASSSEQVTSIPESPVNTDSTAPEPESPKNDDQSPPESMSDESVGKGVKKGATFPTNQVESYIFDEPFLWFLHATNEEPMFMGIIESFKRYQEQGQNKHISLASSNDKEGGKLPLVDVIADTANINMWNC